MLAALPKTHLRQPRRLAAKPLTGPEMKRVLSSAGIDAPQVVRSQVTGHYIANIFVPGLQEPVPPADDLAAKLLRAFSGVKIVEVGETRADWRPDQPVVMVGITFTADQIKTKPLPQPEGISYFAAPSHVFGDYVETHEPSRI
jgi:hypothetical protein